SAGRGLLTGNFGIEGILNEFHGGPSAGRELSSLEKNNIINYERQKQQISSKKATQAKKIDSSIQARAKVVKQRSSAKKDIQADNKASLVANTPEQINIMPLTKEVLDEVYKDVLELSSTLNKNPSNKEQTIKPVYVREALDLIYQKHISGDIAGAIAEYDKLIKALPNNPTFYFGRGLLKDYYLGDYASAIEDYKKAFKYNHENKYYKDALENAQDQLKEQTNQDKKVVFNKKEEILQVDAYINSAQEVESFKQVMQGLREKLFDKKNNKVYLGVLPITMSVVMQAVDAALDLAHKKPTIKKAFNHAEARTLGFMEKYNYNSQDSLELFCSIFEVELVAAGIPLERVQELLQEAQSYMNGEHSVRASQETTTEFDELNKNTTADYDDGVLAFADDLRIFYDAEKDAWIHGYEQRQKELSEQSDQITKSNYYLGYESLKNRNYQEAIKYFDKDIAENTNSAASYFYRGQAKYYLKDYKGSLNDITRAIKMLGKNADSEMYLFRISINEALGDYQAVIDDYKVIIDKLDYNSDMYNLYKSLYNDQIKEAQEKLDILKKQKEAAKAQTSNFNIMVGNKKLVFDSDTQTWSYENNSQEVVSPSVNYHLIAMENMRNHKYQEAIESFDQEIAQNPKNALAYYYRGEAKYYAGDYKGSLGDISKAIKMLGSEAKSDMYAFRAYAKESLNDYKGAIEDYQTAIKKLNPESDMRSVYESVYGDLVKEADEKLNATKKTSDTRKSAYSEQIKEDASKLGTSREELTRLEQATGLYQEAVAAREKYNNYHNINDLNLALEKVSQAIDLFANNSDYHWFRGEVRELLKDYDGAIDDYKKVMVISPRAKYEMLANIKKVEKERKDDKFLQAMEGLINFAGKYNVVELRNADNKSIVKQALQNIREKLFGKKDKKLHAYVLPITMSAVMQALDVAYDLVSKRAKIKEVYNHAEERTLAYMTRFDLDADEALRLFSSFFEVELVAAGVPLERAQELIQEAKNYMNGEHSVRASQETTTEFDEVNKNTTSNYDGVVAFADDLRIFYDTEKEEWIHGYEKDRDIQNVDTTPTNYGLGLTNFQNKNYKEALNYFDKAIEENSDNVMAYFYRGQIKYYLKDYQDSLADLTKGIKMLGDYADIEMYLFRTSVNDALGNYQAAIDDYKTIISKLDKNSDMYDLYKSLYEDQIKEAQEKINLIEQIRKTPKEPSTNLDIMVGDNKLIFDPETQTWNPENTSEEEITPQENYYFKGMLSLKAKKYDEAIKYFDKEIAQNSKSAMAYYYRGEAKYYAGDYQGSLEDISKAIKMLGSEAKSDMYAFRAYAKEGLNDYQGAIEDFQTAIKKLDPESDMRSVYESVYGYLIKEAQEKLGNLQNKRNESKQLYESAEELYNQEDYQESLRNINQAIEKDSDNAVYYLLRAKIKESLGDYQGAVDDYELAAKYDPSNAELYFNYRAEAGERGAERQTIENLKKFWQGLKEKILTGQSSKEKEAQKARQEEIYQQHQEAKLYYNEAERELKKLNFKQALYYYEQAIKYDPNNAGYYFRRGYIYDNYLNDYHWALKDYDKAIELDSKKGPYYYRRAIIKKNYKGDIADALSDLAKSIKYSKNKADKKHLKWLFEDWSEGQTYEEYIQANPEFDSESPKNTTAQNQNNSSTLFALPIPLPKFIRNFLTGQSSKEKEEQKAHQEKIYQQHQEAENHYMLGEIFAHSHEYEKALKEYDKAIELDSKKGVYYYRRALLKKEHKEDIADVLNDLAKSIKYARKSSTNSLKWLFKEWSGGQTYEEYIQANPEFASEETKEEQNNVNTFNQDIQGLKENLFGKEKSDKLFMALPFVPKSVMQLLTNDITLEQLTNRTEVIETAFYKAQKRVPQEIVNTDEKEALKQFAYYFKMELEFAGVDAKKIEKLVNKVKEHIGLSSFESAEYDKALRALQIYENTALAARFTNDYETAIKYYNIMIKYGEDNEAVIKSSDELKTIIENAYFSIATIKYQLKQYKEAIEYLKKAIDYNGGRNESYKQMLELWTQEYSAENENKTEQAQENSYQNTMLGDKEKSSVKEDDYKLFMTFPYLPKVVTQVLLGEKTLGQIGNEIKAERYFKKAEKNKYIDISLALEYYNEAIRLNPNKAEYFFARGYLKDHSLQDYIGALQDYTKAIELDPNNAEYYHQRGFLRTYGFKDGEEADKDYDKAISLDTRNHKYYYHKALLNHDILNNSKVAIVNLALAIKYAPRDIKETYKNKFQEWSGQTYDDYMRHTPL
ncbi:MAG: tetratricopeptide repeat protein, partial [Elusimicrobiaceae bacterium]|nr:tetratricopeptide repeat protein [Elusimicrobiaceae bacterium]